MTKVGKLLEVSYIFPTFFKLYEIGINNIFQLYVEYQFITNSSPIIPFQKVGAFRTAL